MTASDVAAEILRGLSAQRHDRPLTAIEERAVGIAAALGVRPLKRNVWAVLSQSAEKEYRVCGDACDCPFGQSEGRCACKHSVAVGMFCELAAELSRRVGRGNGWDDTLDDAQEMLATYTAMVAASARYRPPTETLLYAFRLEAIGDDAWQHQRQARRAGRHYEPRKARDVRPDRPWVAALNGLSPRYEFQRGFLSGQPDYRDANKYGDRGVYLYFQLPAGVYEIYERQSHYKSRRYFARVADLDLIELTKQEVLTWLCPGEPN